MDWNSLQEVTQGLSLKELLNSEFIKNVNDEFEDKKIEITSIKIKVSDKDSYEVNYVTLFTRNLEDLVLDKIVVDVENHEDLDKIKSAIEKIGD